MHMLPRTRLKLLIVDDDPNTRALLGEALETRGACVRAASSARAARRTLVAWHPDLVISDVGMPHENGYELMRRVRRLPMDKGGATPAIACTAYARAEDRARAMDAGFDALVPKPVDLDLLVDTIAHVAGVRGPGTSAEAAGGESPERPPRRSAPDS